MSSKFLNQSALNLTAVTDGSLALFGASLGAADLTPGFPVKVDADRELYTTTLAESDVAGLTSDLGHLQNKTQNITEAKTSAGVTYMTGLLDGLNEVNANTLSMPQINTTPTPPGGVGWLYSDTSNELHYTTQGGGDITLTGAAGAFLKLDGTSTMAGDIAMGTHNVTGFTALVPTSGKVVIGSTASGGTNAVAIGSGASAGSAASVAIGLASNTSTTAAVAAGASASASGANAIAIGVSTTASASSSIAIGLGITNSTASSALIGDPAMVNLRPGNTGLCDLGATGATFNNAYLSGSLIGSSTTSAVNNIVTNAGAAVSGNVATFSGATGKIIQDSGASLSQYLPLSGGTMSGDIAMGTHNLTGWTALVPTSGKVVIGSTASGGTNAVAIGSGASAASTASVAIGLGANTSTTASTAIGASASASGANAIAIGVSTTASASSSIAIGLGITNATASSALIGDPAMVNLRPGSDALCDLGTGTARYHDLYLSNSIQGTITITSPTLVTPILGAATATSIAFSPTTGGIIGTTAADSAGAGKVGEVITSAIDSGSAVPLSNNTGANVTSISVTAGDWDVSGTIFYVVGAGTAITSLIGGISTSSTNVGAPPTGASAQFMYNLPFTASGVQGFPCGITRANNNSTITYYLATKCLFSVNTLAAYGHITARRMR